MADIYLPTSVLARSQTSRNLAVKSRPEVPGTSAAMARPVVSGGVWRYPCDDRHASGSGDLLTVRNRTLLDTLISAGTEARPSLADLTDQQQIAILNVGIFSRLTSTPQCHSGSGRTSCPFQCLESTHP